MTTAEVVLGLLRDRYVVLPRGGTEKLAACPARPRIWTDGTAKT